MGILSLGVPWDHRRNPYGKPSQNNLPKMWLNMNGDFIGQRTYICIMIQ